MANEITGLDEVIEKMRLLGKPRKVKNAATRSARKAMNIVNKAAKANAKAFDDKGSGNKIWKNIATQPGKTKGVDFVMMKVGVKGGAKKVVGTGNSGGDTWYWRQQELGNSRHAAQPFMRPAFFNNKDAVEAEFKRSFNEELDKEIAKL